MRVFLTELFCECQDVLNPPFPKVARVPIAVMSVDGVELSVFTGILHVFVVEELDEWVDRNHLLVEFITGSVVDGVEGADVNGFEPIETGTQCVETGGTVPTTPINDFVQALKIGAVAALGVATPDTEESPVSFVLSDWCKVVAQENVACIIGRRLLVGKLGMSAVGAVGDLVL